VRAGVRGPGTVGSRTAVRSVRRRLVGGRLSS
jgi:hypothetical protein